MEVGIEILCPGSNKFEHLMPDVVYMYSDTS